MEQQTLGQREADALLQRVLGEARALGIPVSGAVEPAVRLNRRASGRLGCCRRTEEGYLIEVAGRLLEAGEGPVRETLAHEVLHTCRGCQNHGKRWKDYAARMSGAYGYRITRTGSWERYGLESPKKAKYLLVCHRCGREFSRQRRCALVDHPERYRCTCGGQLERREPPERTVEK